MERLLKRDHQGSSLGNDKTEYSVRDLIHYVPNPEFLLNHFKVQW
jgi:hypothetical protein